MSGHAARFFRVDLRQWPAVCDLGLHAALVYLGLSAGRIGKTPNTQWGALALSTRLGLPCARVRDALRHLERAGLVLPVSALMRRVVESDAPEYAWRPQSAVLGAGEERTPLQLLRETGDALLVRLFVELYGRHELPDDNGLSLRTLSRTYSKQVICARAPWTVIAYTEPGNLTTHLGAGDPLIGPHLRPAAKRGQKPVWDDWWTRCNHLLRLGLLQQVPRLMETDDPDAAQACSLWPPHYGPHDVAAEVRVGRAAQEAAHALMDDEAWGRLMNGAEHTTILVAVPTHMQHATLLTGFRLRYRPQTAQTAVWWASLHALADTWEARYGEVIAQWTDNSRRLPTASGGGCQI